MKLGEKLRTHRERRNWTQPEAAEAIGIEQSYLSKLENDRSVPSLEVFRKVAGAYETNVAELMDGIDPGEFAHLTQITDVADYLNTEKRARQIRTQRRTTLQVVAVALGASLIYAGVSALFFPSADGGDVGWRNQMLTFVGIFSLMSGLLGLLVASARQKNRGS